MRRKGTGSNPTDRAKLGWKWSIASEAAGIPIGWAINGANRHDIRLLGPSLATVTARSLDLDIETLHRRAIAVRSAASARWEVIWASMA